MHRNELSTHWMRAAVGSSFLLRFESEFESKLQLLTTAAGQLPLGHIPCLLFIVTECAMHICT
jgi:hypothetical protein